MDSLWRYQWLKNKVELTDELNQTIYDESQGIVDIAVKLFGLAQGRAIESGQEVITPVAIRQVAKDDLKLVHPMLKALKDGRMSELKKFADIMPMDIEEYLVIRESKLDLRATIERKKDILARKRQDKKTSNVEAIMTALIALGINVETAEKAIEKAIKQQPNGQITEIMHNALKIAENLQLPKKKKAKKENGLKLLEIIELAKKNKKSNYDALKEAGYIKSPADEFII